MVTGLSYSTRISRAAESVGRWSCISGRFTDADVGAILEFGPARRGTGHVARNYERSLRLVGLWVDGVGASRVTIIDQAGTYLVRALPQQPTEPPFLTVALTADALETMAAKRRTEGAQGRGWMTR